MVYLYLIFSNLTRIGGKIAYDILSDRCEVQDNEEYGLESSVQSEITPALPCCQNVHHVHVCPCKSRYEEKCNPERQCGTTAPDSCGKQVEVLRS